MKSIIKMSKHPPVPIRCLATAGGTSPRFDSSAVIGSERATDASPRDVAKENGIANQQRPPSRYPFQDAVGVAASAHCQYEWSTKTCVHYNTQHIRQGKKSEETDRMEILAG